MDIHFKQNLDTRTQPKVWEYVWNIIVTQFIKRDLQALNSESFIIFSFTYSANNMHTAILCISFTISCYAMACNFDNLRFVCLRYER